ncbi:uncharacterized protein LOC122510496 isoform X2 [Leptopilina heterotoma]|uniref:uncharacterized protein LOC122510496 isoform X2 n=1 Tax=Leptopilina heterotoma TaxID=63436 RepID=UPI001CA8CBD1|nr:uncharacterized protein LOC122510496 isoform X2 [Leptopilina heterotoma]
MKYRIIPLERNSDISYRVKCVSVENERVFGDVLVTNQMQDSVYCKNCFPSVWRKKKFNLIKKTLESPDFMEMNSNPVSRRRSTICHVPGMVQKNFQRSKSVGDEFLQTIDIEELQNQKFCNPKIYPEPLNNIETVSRGKTVTTLVDQLLSDIYGIPSSDRGKSESDSSLSSNSQLRHTHLQKTRLMLKTEKELRVVLKTLMEHVSYEGGLLIRQLRRRDYLLAKRDKQYDVITAHLYTHCEKTSEDAKIKFSLSPQPGESGFTQWLDAMKMVAGLPGGIPPEFRKRLWITLAERHLDQRGVDWKQAEKVCFNEWSNPDDEELGSQIVKDLHRTGCSLFCGAAGRDNQAVLRRVLLGFARWNKSVGYCQGLNVLAALILQVVDRAESLAVKVMIYLIEGVLPEGYFADNLRGLSVDMAVFRDLLRIRLPRLSKHLEALQTDAKDKATGSSYEPPLTNVFTMQWFLTLFCHCLPQEAVFRVWDLIFLEGDEVLLRTALSIWEGLSDRIMTVKSADEFYSIMGVLTREMLEFTDTNNLIKTIVSMGSLYGVTSLREKHRYNITPWARRLSDDEDDSETEEEERLAVAAAAAIFSMPHRKKVSGALQSLSGDREKLALDITTLKQQYAKLRERQRQAHIILSAACARQSLVTPPTSAMNHLLAGKSALISGRSRQISTSALISTSKVKSLPRLSPRSQSRKDRQAVTIHWKDMKKRQSSKDVPEDEGGQPDTLVHSPESMSVTMTSSKRSSADSDSDSTSTELCDEPDRLSDVDSEEPTSSSDCYVMATDDEKSPRLGSSPIASQIPSKIPPEVKNEFTSVCVVGVLPDTRIDGPPDLEETSIAEITDQIRRLSAGDKNVISSGVFSDRDIENKNSDLEVKDGSSFDYHFLGNVSRLEESDINQLSESTVSEGVNYDYKSFHNLLDQGVSDSSIVKDSNEALDRTYSKDFALDPLPISPLTIDQNLSKVSESINLDPLESNGWSSNLEYIYPKSPVESKKSPKTPESASSGETMGPDSKTSSVMVSPKISIRSDSRALEKSTSSSVSSDSKTLTLQSIEADLMAVRAKLEPKVPSFDKSCSSTPISLDSLKAKSDCSPKLGLSSSSESYSPNKLKSSERSFSSDLQSPISANSIKYSSNYKDNGNLSDTPPVELVSITSPFYPIAHPNQKTPSPYDSASKKHESQVSPTVKYSIKSDYSLSNDFLKNKDSKVYAYKNLESSFESDLDTKIGGSAFSSYQKCKFDDSPDKDDDSLSPLPKENNSNLFDSLGVKRKESHLSGKTLTAKPFERSCSSLDKKFPNLTSSSSQEELSSSVKKRSSDILEDIKHLESKSDYPSDTNMLTKKTGYIWEDVQNLEARRLDTFSDSASGFSISRLNIPGISISNENRKTYIVEPKINIDESSDSILKKVAHNTINKDDDKEAKLGVWTKVKPRKIGDNGRRSSSDRALKIIQENSAILQKILTCQAKKRLPDLEEISKEITISPINEEISKIFSPILEKMGFNEHEINEELAKINFKDITSTTSEFDAKINDELCKLSLIGDDDIESVDLDEIISQDYLETRDAFIDRQINEELSKLLSNYDNESSSGSIRNQKVDIDLYKYQNSIEPKNGLSTQEEMLHSEKYNSYVDPIQLHPMSFSPMNQTLNPNHSLNSVNQTFSPVHQTFISGHQVYNSVHHAQYPLNETFSPVSQTLSPLHQTQNPLMQTVSPLRQTFHPLGETLSPSQQVFNHSYHSLNSTTTHNALSSPMANQSLSPLSQSLNLSTQSYSSNQTYLTTKYSPSNFKPKSDIDIYRELEKLDQISSVQVLSSTSHEIPTLPYLSQNESYSDVSIEYPSKEEKRFDSSPLKSPYDTYKPYDYKQNLSPRISPKKSPIDSYSIRRYDKSYDDGKFEFSNKTFDFEMNHKKVLSKESLEFRVRYDEDQPKSKIDLSISPFQSDLSDLNKGAPYYNDKPITPTNNIHQIKINPNDERFVGTSPKNGDKFPGANEARFIGSSNGERFLQPANEDNFLTSTIDDRFLESMDKNEERYFTRGTDERFTRSRGLSPFEYKYERQDAYIPRERESISPKDYGNSKLEYRQPYKLMDLGMEDTSYLVSIQHKELQLISTSNQFNREFAQSSNQFLTKLSPSSEEIAKNPVSPKFSGIISENDLTSRRSVNHKKSSLTLGDINYTNRPGFDSGLSPTTNFSPFPVRNALRKPKELGLKLGLYSPTSSLKNGQEKKS